MSFRSRHLLAAAVGLWVSQALPAGEAPKPADKAGPAQAVPSGNQKVAEAIAEQLRQDSVLHGLKIDVVFQDGVAEISGPVMTAAQHAEVLRVVKGVSGVKETRDHLTVTGEKVVPVAAQPAPTGNQQIADIIADHLRQDILLRGYKIDVVFQDGVADIGGFVMYPAQREEALRLVKAVPGVKDARDHLMVATTPAVVPTAATQPAPAPAQAQAPMMPGAQQGMVPMMPAPYGMVPTPYGMMPAPYGMVPGPYGMLPVQAAMPPAGGAPMPRPVPDAGAPGMAYPGPVEPAPIYQVGAGGVPGAPYSLTPADMPPYAWPTYAPYNNFSRVAIPTAYPYNAFPFIGPPYPFPKVPLGWRKVCLTWQDGHWWFGKTASCHDWWRLRYW